MSAGWGGRARGRRDPLNTTKWPSPARWRQQKAEKLCCPPEGETPSPCPPLSVTGTVTASTHLCDSASSPLAPGNAAGGDADPPADVLDMGNGPGSILGRQCGSMTNKKEVFFNSVTKADISTCICGYLEKKGGRIKSGEKKKTHNKIETQSSKRRFEMPLLWAL